MNRRRSPLMLLLPLLVLALVVQSGPAFADAPDRFEPPAVDLTLQPGESATVAKTLHLTGLPPKADIILAVDTTGSMGPAIAQAKAEATQLCDDVKAQIPGARFAVVDIEDYPGMPFGGPGDEAYTLLTPGYVADCATVQAAIDTMAAVPGEGGDAPEAFNRQFFESYSDPVLLASRDPQAVRFNVVLGDAAPHSDLAFGACPVESPNDFGRDEVGGTADDLDTPETIAGMNADDTVLLMIHYESAFSSVSLACYEDLAAATGGDAVAGGGGETLSNQIVSLAQGSAPEYTVDLQVNPGCPLALSFSPAPPYGPFQGESHQTFDETITAPTTAGDYTCTVTALINGVPSGANQTVQVRVVPGPPANITLEPSSATNTAGEEHCVTATVTDAFGNPTPGITVNFSVSGANSANGTGVTDANGQAVFCYTGTVSGDDAISATAQGGSNPTATAAKTYEAGPPATLDLTPPTATNVVDSQHCVVATVKDQFGNPVPGVTVNFSVTGSTATTGSAVTDSSGQAQFCYTGPALPGSDTITATAEGGTNPTATATKTWVTPPSTPGCKVTHGGRITAANGDKATFGGNAMANGLKGEQNYQDHGPATPMHVKSLSIDSVVCNTAKTHASIFGTASIDGAGTFNYRIDVKDLNEPGTSDTYRIRLSNGYDSGEKVLEGGNIQIHK